MSRGAGIPLTRGQVNPGRPCLAPPRVSKSENSLVFIVPERFWVSGWRPVGVGWAWTGRGLASGGQISCDFMRFYNILLDFMSVDWPAGGRFHL